MAEEASTLTLIMEKGPREGQTLEFRSGSTIQIGRGRGRVVRNGKLPVNDAGISTDHLFIESTEEKGEEAGQWLVTDVGSSNGTVLNGFNLTPKIPSRLGNGDVIKIGEYTAIRVMMIEVVEHISRLRRNPRRGTSKASIGEDSEPGSGFGAELGNPVENPRRRGQRMTAGAFLNGRAGHENYKLVCCSKKKKTSGEPSLHDELIFSILVWLPAYVLYNSTRYVSRQWYKIIHDPIFCKEQLLCSSSGLFMQDSDPPHTAQFAEIGKTCATITDINFTFPEQVLSTCNGLVLFRIPHNPRTMHVANPLTKQTVTLPLFECNPNNSSISFACAYSKMEYKVLCVYGSHGFKYNCVMLTLGKDHAWRPINPQKLSHRVWNIISVGSLTVGQFLYWAGGNMKSVVAFDVESENFYEFPSPAVNCSRASVYHVKRGRTLSCLVMTRCRSLVDVFVLSDPMTGEWRMLYKIDFGAHKHVVLSGMNHASFPPGEAFLFVPITWVNEGDVLILYITKVLSPSSFYLKGSYFAFNVKTGNIFKVGSKEYRVLHICRGFAPSLEVPTPTEVTIHQ